MGCAEAVGLGYRWSHMMGWRASAAALLLTVPLILLGGCGGDDDSSSTSSGSANRQEGVAEAPSGATGTTGTTGTTSPRPKRTPKQDKSSSGGTDAPAQTVPTSPPETTPQEPAKKEPEDIKYPKLVGRELAKQARVVCGAIPLDQLVKTYRPKSSTPEDVAAAYAASYPASLRKAVAAGCKAGLLESQ